tara:strand:- start:2235 stop:3413 length:1179 start_codon:yes stop_codon:yes gene_type:complete
MNSSVPTETVAGRYRLEREIGRGGNGIVWQATDLRLGNHVAVKRLHPQGDSAERTRNRFLREARLGAAVQHENVVRVLDFGLDGGDPFMVMEQVRGVSLYEWLQTHGLPRPEAGIELAAQILDGLEAIHEAGMVHRDLKPENVMLELAGDGVVAKLLDFGVAAVTDPSTGRRSALTHRRGFAFGTPHYMAPEQARGADDLDARCDVYGAGILLYEMLSGRVPFEADHPGDLLLAIIDGRGTPLAKHRPNLPPGLLEVVTKATARARRSRFASAKAMATALRTVDCSAPAPRKRRRPWTLWASAAAALLGLAAFDMVSASFEPARAEIAPDPVVEIELGAPRLIEPAPAPAPVVIPEVEEAVVSDPAPPRRAPRPAPVSGGGAPPVAFRMLDY